MQEQSAPKNGQARERAEVRVVASPSSWIEGAAVQQLKKTAELPGVKLAVGLPDLHPGKGSPIGAAFVVEGRIYPALVGNDIGCGIGLWRTELSSKKIRREAWADRLRNLDNPWAGDAVEWLHAREIEPSGQESGLGTIGGGNHFAELQAVEVIARPDVCQRMGILSESVYLCVHTGSRGFGEAVLRKQVIELGTHGLAEGSVEASGYTASHNHAKRWAGANRELVAARVLERLRTDAARITDVCHNWVEARDIGGRSCWIHRKGAAPSTEGLVTIPGSRGAFTYVVMPREPSERSAYSLPHGAGRKWSRTDCRARLEKRYSAADLLRSELGTHVICEDRELLYEEAPPVYKDIDAVIEDVRREGLADVVAILRPLVTYKVKR